MDFNEYFKLVRNSERRDWNVIVCWGGGGPSFRDQLTVWNQGEGKFLGLEIDSHHIVASLKADLNISLACGIGFNEEFEESWANGFPDPHASGSFIDFFYSGTLIHRDLYVTVDGGRAHLPLPKQHFNSETHELEKLTITSGQNRFFRLFNTFEAALDYDSYLERTPFEIVEGSWPDGCD